LKARVRVQDEGSQLVGELAACAHESGRERKCDCRSLHPGLLRSARGKTLILAERNPQARIVAANPVRRDLNSRRKDWLYLGDRIDFRLADATKLQEESAFDLALADVPCSGTGTLGRNPEYAIACMSKTWLAMPIASASFWPARCAPFAPGAAWFTLLARLNRKKNEQWLLPFSQQLPMPAWSRSTRASTCCGVKGF